MSQWLVKTEPSDYSFTDLVRDRRTTWSGVKNAQALINLRAMRKGDDVLIYHTGEEKSVVGAATVVAADGDGEVELQAGEPLWRPVSLAEIKIEKSFADWLLVRNGRLSVMPVSDAIWKRIAEMSGAAFTNTESKTRKLNRDEPKKRATKLANRSATKRAAVKSRGERTRR